MQNFVLCPLSTKHRQKSHACKTLRKLELRFNLLTTKNFLNCFKSKTRRARMYSSAAEIGTPNDGKTLFCR